MHTLEENIVSKVRSELDNVIVIVETRVQDALLTARESIGISRVELAMKSANASSGRSVDVNVMEPDQRNFSGYFEGVQMTAPSRIDSRRDLSRIDETRGNITVEEGDSVVNEKNIDRETHTHHIITGENAPQELPELLSRYIANYRETTESQNMITQLSRDTT